MSNLCSEICRLTAPQSMTRISTMPVQAMYFLQFRFVEYCPHHGFPQLCRTVETAVRGLTAVSDMSHIPACRPSKPEMPPHTPSGWGREFTRLSGARRHRLWFAGSTGFTNLYFYTITWHALRTSMLRHANAVKPSPGSNSHAMPVVIFQPISARELAAENDESWRTFARSGITLPTREMWAQLRDA